MNLIEREFTPSTISTYRAYQYELVPFMITSAMKYLMKFGLNVDPNMYQPDESFLSYIPDMAYSKIGHFSCTQIKIRIEPTDKKTDYFLYFSLPNLLYSTFFKLNGTYYIPLIYITDEPITIKKQSISIYSLFQPISIYPKEKRMVFKNSNFTLTDFIHCYCYKWKKEEREELLNIFEIDPYPGYVENSNFKLYYDRYLKETITYLANKLHCQENLEAIKQRVDDLFFDDWSVELYRHIYNIGPEVENIFRIIMERYKANFKPSFIDLRYKRLTFIEPLLKPLFRQVTFATLRLLTNSTVRHLKADIGCIVKHFFNVLDGNSLYDTTNGFSGILSHKATFKNPFSDSNLPPEISSIHWTHKNRICPNSIANRDPGEKILLVPDQEIDCKFGTFKFTEEEMLKP